MRGRRRDRGNASIAAIRIDGFPLVIKLDDKQCIRDWQTTHTWLLHGAERIREIIRKFPKTDSSSTATPPGGSVPDRPPGGLHCEVEPKLNLRCKETTRDKLHTPTKKGQNELDSWFMEDWDDVFAIENLPV